MITSHAKGTRHDCKEDLPGASAKAHLTIDVSVRTYNSGSLFAPLCNALSFPFPLPASLAFEASLPAAWPALPATRPAAADMVQKLSPSGG